MLTPTLPVPDLRTKESTGVIAAWYHGCSPNIVWGLKPEHFADVRARAAWAAILENAKKPNPGFMPEVDNRAREIACLPESAWDGYWPRIELASAQANAFTMQDDARSLLDNSHFVPSDMMYPVAMVPARLGGDDHPQLYKKPRYTVYTAADALAPQPPVNWVVDQLIAPGSVSIFYGFSATKKTYSLISLGVHATLGKDWLGFKVRACRVLFIDEESNERRLKMRLHDALNGAGAGASTQFSFVSLAGFKLSNPQDVDEIIELIRKQGAGLVIIDSLAAIKDGDENSVNDVQPVMSALRRIAAETDAAVVVIHHRAKSGSYRGSTAIMASMDVLVRVTSEPGSPFVNFQVEKNRDGDTPRFAGRANWVTDPVDPQKNQFYLESAVWVEKKEESGRSPAEEFVLNYLNEHGESSRTDILAATGDICSPKSASNALYDLLSDEVIRRVNPDEKGYGTTARFALVDPQEDGD